MELCFGQQKQEHRKHLAAKGNKTMMTYTDFSAFGQDSIDSIVKANTAAAKGFESLSKYFVDYATKSFEDAVTAGKKLAASKTPVEFFQLQTKLVQESFETFVEESKTVSEMTTAIVKDVSAPLTTLFKTTVAAAPKAATMKKAA
jgi:phasin family protein